MIMMMISFRLPFKLLGWAERVPQQTSDLRCPAQQFWGVLQQYSYPSSEW
jgi:hypothetical protein